MKSTHLLYLCALAAVPTAQGASILADKVLITRTTAISAFHITEVQVFEQGTAMNVAASAAGAIGSASSTGWGTQPGWANDGNTDGGFGANSTWHDLDGQAGDDPLQQDVLTIAFSGPKIVDSFQVWGRNDCCPERDDSFSVDFYLGNALVSSQPSGITAGFDTGLTAIVPEPSLLGLVAGTALFGLRRRRTA